MAAPVKLSVWQSIVLLLTVYSTSAIKQKHVSLTLDAKWRSTPMVLEASEYVSQDSSEKFWSFVEDFSQLTEDEIENLTDQALYGTIQKFAARYLSQMQVQLLKFALALRALSPKVAMYNQIAKDYKQQFGQCEAFLDVHGEMSCQLQDIDRLVQTASSRTKTTTFKFDHVYPGSESGSVTVILYAELGRASFQGFHTTLKKLANQGDIQYIFRHYVQTPPDNSVRLSGYGVELAIKSTEYKAKDDTKVEGGDGGGSSDDMDQEDDVQGFIFSTLKKLHPDASSDLTKFKTHLVESSSELEPLKVWELQDLSFQAAQRVLSASPEDALKVLTDISQNFPSKTRSLVNVQVSNEMKGEVQRNQKVFQSALEIDAGDSAMFVNGLQVDLDVMDMFLLLDLLRSEATLLDGLHSSGIKGDALTKMLSLNLKDNEEYALDIRHESVMWINDLENDSRYSRWPNRVEDMLRPTWPGMLRHVAKNFFHMVLYVNPADKSSIQLIKMAESFFVHNAPARIGVVLVPSSGEDIDYLQDASVALYRAFNFIEDSYSAPKALSFLTDVYERARGDEVTSDMVVSVFKKTISSNVDDILGSGSEHDENRQDTIDYFESTGLGELPQVLINGVPLKRNVLNVDDFEENVVSTIMQMTPAVQRDVYQGRIHDNMNILDYLMGKDNILTRLNSRVLSSVNATYLSFSETTHETLDSPPASDLSNDDLTAAISRNMIYLTKQEEDSIRPLTTWVVSDLDTQNGRELMYNAIKSLRSTSDMRLGIVHSPKVISSDSESHFIPRAVQAALISQPMHLSKLFITKLLKEENVDALDKKEKTLNDLEVHGMDMDKFFKSLDDLKQTTSFLQWGQTFAQKVLNFRLGNRGLVANGKVLGPLRPDESFLTEDFHLLDQFFVKKSAGKIRDIIKSMNLKPSVASELIMKTCALLESKASSESSRKKLELSSEQYSVVSLPGKSDQPAHDIVAILDPLSREAQKLSPLLMVLKEVTNANIKLVFNCRDKLSEMPLKSYYRFVLEPEPQFRVDGSLTSGPSARFTNLPQKPILTMNMNPPESWLVEVVRAAYDLDNIVMEEVENSVNAELELEYLLLEGHCFDSASGQPPRGLQFTLGTSSNPVMVDTIVMANLGYFQLKANPGSWLLDLREGRSADLYDIASHDHTESANNNRPLTVVIDNFRGKTVKIMVKKKPDKMTEDLLDEGDDKKSMWDSLSSTFGGGDDGKEEKDDTLNIFSLASGHLYERFLRTMMLSVLKNTQSKVKFWFLKNYLSPSFNDFLPYYAEKYGFEYELVQYKWPRWLHQQTEKQRIIWGYKILFLDVLFPLHVKKIIFVDADQTVRADLQELYDLDLGGAPYGYTPFCDSREDMDGFRFWKQGYWMNHLAGRKYHISALYVVDLKKFRRIAAGDRLRGQYQGLSQDPNSLSNLDQDLPNNMIHQVAIKSLPQDWLWCETWCDDRSKKTAKTIDLCNNPKTKEPKLQAAERIVGEWKDNDNEIKQLWEEYYKNNNNKSRQKTTDNREQRQSTPTKEEL